MEKTVFERMGGGYVRQGDYELPAVSLPTSEEIHVGIWGQRYRRWLKENHRVLYYNLITTGKLDKQLAEVDKRAEGMFLRLVAEMAEHEGVSENLKASDMMAWVGRMNSIRSAVNEAIYNNIIYEQYSLLADQIVRNQDFTI